MKDQELLTFLQQAKASGVEYRDKFTSTWKDCENQVRCVPPDSWKEKEDWQTKIYIPLQSKTSEIAESYLGKMVFGKGRNFDLTGIDEKDKEEANALLDLLDVLISSSGFPFENKFVMQEAIDLGTSFLKLTMSADGQGLVCTWRSAYNVVFDPACGHNWDKARFAVDLYTKDIAYIISEARKDKSIYDKKVIQRFIDDAISETTALNQQNTTGKPADLIPLMTLKSIDGTQDIQIPQKYKTVNVDEYWIEVPDEKTGEYAKRVITVLSATKDPTTSLDYILRNDENPFGFIPFRWCRIKPRKYDSYAKGYIENTRGLQELMNSLVNLGFDSQKITSMDIIVVDKGKVRDPGSIKYKPLAVWDVKDTNAVKMQRNTPSAITDILRGINLIDQIHQDATGATRQAQGSPNLSGSGTAADTLGEYQLKLQAIDQRFLDVGRFIEADYWVPFVKMVFRIVTNEKLFSQDKVDRLIGKKKVDDIQVENGVAKIVGTKEIPKLDLTHIRQKGEMGYDFKAVGITQFTDRLETLAKLKEALQIALSNPTLSALTKVDELWKRLWQVSEIPDYDDFLRTKDEVKKLLGVSEQAQPPMNMPPPGQPPQVPMQGGM